MKAWTGNVGPPSPWYTADREHPLVNETPQFLTAKEVAVKLGLEPSTFASMVSKGDLPHGVEITGKKLKMWPSEDVAGIAWLLKCRSRMRKSTVDEAESEVE